jgi:hypothetical protein
METVSQGARATVSKAQALPSPYIFIEDMGVSPPSDLDMIDCPALDPASRSGAWIVTSYTPRTHIGS